MKSFLSAFLTLMALNCFSQAQSYELGGPAGKDTLNLIDINNWKQGKWITRGMNQPTKGYRSDQNIESGRYKDNLKIGEWIFYHNNGNIKNKIRFVNGSIKGTYTAYHRDGSVFIEGERISTRWKGKLTIHDKFGNTLIIHHDENGNEISKEFIKATK
ncbi:MAG TPA: hypothetical protein PLC65_15985 [Bacteroidia bacterium]|nr:hypothetical protein [Bacteroidia bacterium]